MPFLSTLLLAVIITICLVPVCSRLAIRANAVDIPNERKVHCRPLPRCGGLAMALGVLITLPVWSSQDVFIKAYLIGFLILVGLGLVDDFKNLGWMAKFGGQIAAASVVVFYGGVQIKCVGTLLPDGYLLPGWICLPLTVLAIVGVTNAINLADGLDGLAGGICLLSFCCIGALAYMQGDTAIALLAIAISGALFGFLRFNTYPATLFMGDTGSQFLGFSAITLSLALTQGNTALSPLLPLVILGFPVLDTLTVMLERVYKGRSPFVADNNHFHHKLLRLGLYHTEAVFLIYVIQAFLVIFAFFFRFYSEWLLLGFYLVFSGLILTGFWVAGKTQWQLKRYDIVDRVIKGKLKELRQRGLLINYCFKVVKIGLPALLIFLCLLPATPPRYVSVGAAVLCLGIFLSLVANNGWMVEILRLSLYLSIPFLIYLGELHTSQSINGQWMHFYNLSFAGLALFVVLTLKFTRRKQGFKVTPMDFLILFIALVLPNLPHEYLHSHQVGIIAAKVIVLFFSYEVLVGELRGKLNGLGIATMAALAIVSLRAFL
jgi:UDP-GlcNAc:undecaprenyl-phosphate GlcNAc-1-phosphate transferase